MSSLARLEPSTPYGRAEVWNPLRRGTVWWAKLAAKAALSRLPVRRASFRRFGVFELGPMASPDYALRFFDEATKAAGCPDIDGMRVLELGPGEFLFSALVAHARGARAVLVDDGLNLVDDVAPYRGLQARLERDGARHVDLVAAGSVDDVLRACGAIHLTHGLLSLRELDTGSIDLVLSHHVLEHVRKSEFSALQREVSRVLRPDGVAFHAVDLRDHLDFGLNNLRFSSRVWESRLIGRSGCYTNRIRFTEMIECFEQAGFTTVVIDLERWTRLPTPRRRLTPEFRSLPDDELLVSAFSVRLRPRRT
jgi:SAM-dependent methyltransferase